MSKYDFHIIQIDISINNNVYVTRLTLFIVVV